jgi:glycosyltransferase involved in cell wall biosynthesis/SAM-dependent methyltransferase
MLPNLLGVPPTGQAGRKRRRIALTVDVEAFELRSRSAPVEKLIWGRFPEGDYGLERIMTLAEAQGATLSAFLDYPEFYAYGDALLDVGREIVKRGHDLNLHLHLDCIPPGYFAKRGLPEGLELNTFTDEVARACVDDLRELHARVTPDAPSALRGGGYRYNAALLRALRAGGVPISSNYNPAAKLQPFALGPRRQFMWDNGTVELPIATQVGFLNRSYATHFNFNIAPFIAADGATAVANARSFLDRFYAEHGDDAIAVFVLHSWSFLRMDSAGEFSAINEAAPERLAELLASWSEFAEFVTMKDCARLAETRAIALDGPIAIPARHESVATNAAGTTSNPPPAATPTSASSCAICGTSAADFVDYNGPKRRCSGCGSTERQRGFAELYPRFVKPEFDLSQKRLLVAAPGSPEKYFLRQQGIEWLSVDIRPEVKADLVADLCDLSQIADGSFDAVLASFVLTCVHDLDACLLELRRILRPGGRLFTCDPVVFGAPTVEHTERERITSWYGSEAYDKYRIGVFRTFGDLDLLSSLQEHGFTVKTLYALDEATSSRWVWHMSIKPALEQSSAAERGAATTWAALKRSQDEVQRLGRRVAELELEQQRYRVATAALGSELERTKETLSFRLGHLLIHAPKSWQGLRGLPRELRVLQREAQRRRNARRGIAAEPDARRDNGPEREIRREPREFAELAFRVFALEGVDAAIELVDNQARGEREQAFALTRLAKALAASDPVKALVLAQRAHDLEPVPYRTKWLAFLKYNSGELRGPNQMLERLSQDELNPKERERAIEIAGLTRIQSALPRIPSRGPRAYQPIAGSSLYVTGSCLPFHVAGYTVRSQAMIRALGSAGWAVTAATRPGYPIDRGVDLAGSSHEHDGVTYRHSPGPNVRKLPFDRFTEAATEALIRLAQRTRPQLIHAASNHVNALPALLAARRLGVPFVYEVRGLWELTTATKHVNWEETERFALQRDLEALVAREADQVFTLTAGLAEELSARGVSKDRIAIVPNCVDPEQFPARARDTNLAARLGLDPGTLTVVYAGSLLHYEGLDDLVRAVAQLTSEKVDLKLVVAGDGEARDGLSRLVADLGVGRRVKLLGRLPPDQIPALWSVADMAAFPRKPFRVCELVSPLKPLEPMVMGLPVVVSDVQALREMVQPGRTGLVHRAGDAQDLADRLRELTQSSALREELGRAAREAILRERTWDAAGRSVVEAYRELCSGRDSSMTPGVSAAPGIL